MWTAARRGTYRLVPRRACYTYIPPRPPRDLRGKIAALTRRPVFSIVVPIYDAPTDVLCRLLVSVFAQWYPEWELIFGDDASHSTATKEYLARLSDPRIKVIFGKANRGISEATNLALQQATGDYVVFLDHEDELTEDCLYELAVCIALEEPDFIYSDEDKVAPNGSFLEPFFKPDWSPDTLMSTMYACHVSCARRRLIEEVGRLRSEFDGSPDWDLILRIVEKTNRIAHIPRVLYHRRIIPSSAAGDLNPKPYAIDAGRRARIDALKRRGLSGDLEPVPQFPGYFRVRYDLVGKPLISIIIPSRDNGATLRRCVESVMERSSYRKFEILIIDNGSTEQATLDLLLTLARSDCVTVISHDAPFNFSKLNNIGAEFAKGELLLFLNDDTEVVSAEWLERMGGFAQLPHVGAVGAKLLYPATRLVQHGGVLNLSDGPVHAFMRQSADAPGYFGRNLLEFNWIAVTGACMMIEREKFMTVGRFNENVPIAYNDVDLCFKLIRAGFFQVLLPGVHLLHHESVSRGKDLASVKKRARLDRERRMLYVRHPEFFLRDPFYSPNLAPNSDNFDLAG